MAQRNALESQNSNGYPKGIGQLISMKAHYNIRALNNTKM